MIKRLKHQKIKIHFRLTSQSNKLSLLERFENHNNKKLFKKFNFYFYYNFKMKKEKQTGIFYDEMSDLKTALSDSNLDIRRGAIRRIISGMTLGKDVS